MDDINETNILFARLQRGIKGATYGTDILLVNDTPGKELEIIFSIEEKKYRQRIPYGNIRNISFQTKMRVRGEEHKVEEHQTNTTLLAAAMFGGNPMMQMLGQMGMKSLIDTQTGNYDKVKLDREFQIDIEYASGSEERKVVLISDNTPEEFITKVLTDKQ